jgi:hypothetical protein
MQPQSSTKPPSRPVITSARKRHVHATGDEFVFNDILDGPTHSPQLSALREDASFPVVVL